MMIRYFKINELKKGRTKKGEEKIYISFLIQFHLLTYQHIPKRG